MSLQRAARKAFAISSYFPSVSAEVKAFAALDTLYSLAGASQARCSHTLASCRPRCVLTPGPQTSLHRANNNISATLNLFTPSLGYLPASSSGKDLQYHVCMPHHKDKREWLIRRYTCSLEAVLSSRISGGIRRLRERSRHCDYGGRLCHQDPSDWHNLCCCLETWPPHRYILVPAHFQDLAVVDEPCQESLCCGRARLSQCPVVENYVTVQCWCLGGPAALTHENMTIFKLCGLIAFILLQEEAM